MANIPAASVLGCIEMDEKYERLKLQLYDEFDCVSDADGTAYRQVLNDVSAVLSKAESYDVNVKLNGGCLLLLHDIAQVGICRFPWQVSKMLLLLVWNRVFDEIYESEHGDTQEHKYEFKREKQHSLEALLHFTCPPSTLQRLAEIPFKQPYTKIKCIFRAFRKLVTVRDFEYDPVCIPPFADLDQVELDDVYENLNKWLEAAQE